ncbi:MAG: excinuclease ABC subunit UvrA [Candidatus Pacebacteria bacterium]|nr:excinuclease ABC subunit UvrA [Candidatus Paceibacterota bacterium]MDD4333555.1 excinuclease ABC subunit UvrA [Candidatus Paceibacterota bacterium]
MQNKIIIKGAREHNLKNISLEIPREKMIVFTGLSGSGKSSLAFDTIFAEGQRRYLESLSTYARQFLGGMQKPDVDEIEGLSPAIAISQKAHNSNPRSTVATITEIYDYLRVLFARIGKPYCPECNVLIEKMSLDEIVDNIKNQIKDGVEFSILSPVVRGRRGEYYQLIQDLYESGFLEVRIDKKIKKLTERIIIEKGKKHNIEVVIDKFDKTEKDKDFEFRLSEAVETAIDLADGLCILKTEDKEYVFSTSYSCPKCGFSFPEIEPRLFSFNNPFGYCEYCKGIGTESFLSDKPCPVCGGKRLNKNALSVRINNKNIWDVTSYNIQDAFDFINNLKLNKKEEEIAENILNEIKNRLKFLLDVGLNYIDLNRRSGTLSGGEAQRIRLASQVSTKIVGALYVLDEPTIGLHQRDNDKLIKTLRSLCDIGNTIIVVEHDEDTILTSDWIVDFGPLAGEHGGEIVFSGPLETMLFNTKPKSEIKILGDSKKSLTGKYLRKELSIEVPKKRRMVDKLMPMLDIRDAFANNLKHINVKIPLQRFVCFTGVSGSGKSTLMNDVLYNYTVDKKLSFKNKTQVKEIKNLEYIDKIIKIDQSPIGRTPRSNPATYTKVFDYIREIFAATEEARIKGFKSGRFSFNMPSGRCEHCEGRGVIEIEMHFLPNVEVVCDVCKGKRFNRDTLEVHYKGKDIAEVLNLTIEEAALFFKDIPQIYDKLKVLNEVGLGYLRLGQSATTLSGGEAQRVKLSKELSKKNTTKTLYLLDEPTTGLHYEDVKKLIEVIQKLVDQGNTVLVIEHNLDFIKTADWVIDLGPNGGDFGGEVIAEGTPEDLSFKTSTSYTGKYLKKVL